MEEGIIYVQLMDRPGMSCGHGKKKVNSDLFCHRGETIKIINPLNLMIPLGHKTCHVTINNAIWRKFGFKNPTTTNQFLAKGKWNEVPSVVGLKGL